MDNLPLTDAHLHLQDDRFAADLPAVIARGRAADVNVMVCNGSSPADWPAVREIAARFPGVLPCFGLHPWYVKDVPPDWLAQLADLLRTVPSTIGEIGLDRWIEPRDEHLQQHAFLAQLRLAAELGLPVTVHCVRAWGPMMDALRNCPALPARMLFHSFGGSAQIAAELARMGGWFSFAGGVLRKNAHNRRDVLRVVPTDRLLLETDAPDIPLPRALNIAPDPQRNEPANLRAILEGVADVLGRSPADLAALLERNARNFFGDLLPK